LLSPLVLAALLLAGCLGRSPSTGFYSLRALSAEAGTAAESGSLALGVGPTRLPRYLDRPQIARRTGESEIVYDEFQRWASPLEAELLRVLGANLSGLLATQHVVVWPADAPFPLTYHVVIDVERFEAGPDDTVALRARWVIRPSGSGDALVVGQSSFREPARSSAAADLVAAHSAAADKLSRAIAERLRAVAAEAP